jgi:hypothetical protein
MEDANHLKIKIGPHEFEASGSAESVREQFTAFKEMVAAMADATPAPKPPQAYSSVQEQNAFVEKVYETMRFHKSQNWKGESCRSPHAPEVSRTPFF